jgi:hypothetical protein
MYFIVLYILRHRKLKMLFYNIDSSSCRLILGCQSRYRPNVFEEKRRENSDKLSTISQLRVQGIMKSEWNRKRRIRKDSKYEIAQYHYPNHSLPLSFIRVAINIAIHNRHNCFLVATHFLRERTCNWMKFELSNFVTSFS